MSFFFLVFTFIQIDSTDVVFFGGKNVTYFAQIEKVVMVDSAWVHYRDMKLYADSIEYDTKRHVLSAFSKIITAPLETTDTAKTTISYVIFQTEAESIVGLELNYNVDTRKGMMHRANTEISEGFFRGEEIWLVKEKTLNVNQGYYTTCNRNPPHYHFYGSRVRVLMDDMVITQPLILKIGRYPIAIAPFWFFPIGKHRKSGLSPFKVGQSNVDGFYAKNVSYYLVINDYADMTLGLDFMMKRGFYPKLEARYIVDPFASGLLLGTYIREFGTGKVRYSFNANHSSVFFFETNLIARADFQSDERLISDYTEERIEWLKREFLSYAHLSRSFKRFGKVSLSVQQYRDFANDFTDIRLPEAKISFYSRPIFRTWSFSPGLSFGNNIQTARDTWRIEKRSAGLRIGISPPRAFDFGQGFGYSVTKRESLGYLTSSSQSISSATDISSSQFLFQSLNLSEGFSFNENINIKDSISYQSEYNFSTNSSINLYRIFGVEILGLHGLLHRITPSITYSFRPAVRQQGFLGVPRLDTTPLNSSIGFGISNLFQAKLGAEKLKKDICYLNFSSGYNFLNKTLSPIYSTADLYILEQSNLRLMTFLTAVFRVDSLDFTDYSANTNFYYSFSRIDTVTKQESPFSLNLTHFWSPTSNMLTATINFAPRGWQFNISTGSNFKKPWPPADVSIGIVKDLHCWELLINTSGMGTRWAYDFKIRIKAIPEVNVGKGIFGFILP
ncbi:MAG: putative LPS assembly protein LptD [candidate division WOR-3 bacterium]|nr:putative LPS assembly protein LptD [candidate division WOR-3 bacterium]